ncbi:ABC transporter ATP-binding protein [Mannheimia massilioguelmaensis]|uniref:ABC transporter ATP-binding protein n=1 Tax=Mannheimia massilioguelmaensis TaxID=1604354 RepID=UPI0005CB3DF0|nr:ABC transporter ATP-binding protein [Mannheimia massilioguelmaensis]
MANLSIRNLEMRVSCFPNPILQLEKLKILAGEQVAIIGPSGCGKSTLLNLVSGLLKPTSGEIEWDKNNIASLSPAEQDKWRFQHVGMIMQDFYLTPGLSAIENVLLPISFLYWTVSNEYYQKAKDLLLSLNMPNVDTNVEHLSRGEKQRVAIARALIMNPKILIADEPTASLDVENGHKISELLTALCKDQNITLLVATHDPYLIGLMKRCIRLENGRIASDKQDGLLYV